MQASLLGEFVNRIIAASDYTEMDRTYLYNRLLNLLGGKDLPGDFRQTDLLTLVAKMVENYDDRLTKQQQSLLKAQLMDFLVPAPSRLNQKFWQKYQQQGSTAALNYFYHLSQASDYIKVSEIKKNKYFKFNSPYGPLEITINLSKPEKDPRDIARLKTVKASGYPLCQLCFSNEGYQGRLNYPARSNHRLIRFKLFEETWGLQYSPYAYFNEHCIFVDQQHQPMKIERLTFARLLRILDLFPTYFVGSNADLPIVGGSILNHEHFQGGRHVFAMDQAKLRRKVVFKDFPAVQAGILHWPMSVIRLTSRDQEQLIELAAKILDGWQQYSDPTVSVLAETDGKLHHTITPIARKRGAADQLDLVLRDNRQDQQYPAGIFHPHADVQHIKKKNIGLIEVMGLAILPPRLVPELTEVKRFLLDLPNQIADQHLPWAKQIKQQAGAINQANVTAILQDAVGQVFTRVLEDAGVFKNDQSGQAAFDRFITTIGIQTEAKNAN